MYYTHIEVKYLLVRAMVWLIINHIHGLIHYGDRYHIYGSNLMAMDHHHRSLSISTISKW
jgi:hypothetical protein